MNNMTHIQTKICEGNFVFGSVNNSWHTFCYLFVQATGIRLGILTSTAVAGICALAITFVFGWKLGLAILATTPLLGIAGSLMMKLQTGDNKRETREAELAGNVRNVIPIKPFEHLCDWLLF